MVFLSLPLPVYSRHPSCPLRIAHACARHAPPILSMFQRVWLTGCKRRCGHWDICFGSNHICQGNHLDSICAAQIIHKGLCPFNDRECLGDLGDVGIFILLSFLESLPLLVRVPHYHIPGHVRRCKRTTYHRVVSNQLSHHREPHDQFGSEDEWWCWNRRTGGSAWCGIRNSSGRVSKIIHYLFDRVLVEVHEIIRMCDPFVLQLHDRCMGYAHLVVVFEERSPLRCSKHHVDL